MHNNYHSAILSKNKSTHSKILLHKFVDGLQGWGGPAVQYRQSTPVLGNLGPVATWRSYFYDSGIVRTCTECQVLPYKRTGGLGTGGHLRNFAIPDGLYRQSLIQSSYSGSRYWPASITKETREVEIRIRIQDVDGGNKSVGEISKSCNTLVNPQISPILPNRRLFSCALYSCRRRRCPPAVAPPSASSSSASPATRSPRPPWCHRRPLSPPLSWATKRPKSWAAGV